MAAPGIDDSRTRRSALPSVWPKPRSSGSTETFARFAPSCSTCRPRGRRMVVGEFAMNYALQSECKETESQKIDAEHLTSLFGPESGAIEFRRRRNSMGLE